MGNQCYRVAKWQICICKNMGNLDNKCGEYTLCSFWGKFEEISATNMQFCLPTMYAP